MLMRNTDSKIFEMTGRSVMSTPDPYE